MHPRPGGERAGAEQVLADPLDVRARPPRAPFGRRVPAPSAVSSVPAPDRPQLLDRGQQLVDQPRLPVGERLVVPPPARTLGARQQQRPVGDRQQARLVRPVLHQHPGPARRVRPRGVVHQPRVVRPEPAEDRHVVGADGDVHRVELQQPDPGEQPREVAAGDRARRPRVGEPLRRERGAAGGGGADHVDGVPAPVPRQDAASRHRQFPARSAAGGRRVPGGRDPEHPPEIVREVRPGRASRAGSTARRGSPPGRAPARRPPPAGGTGRSTTSPTPPPAPGNAAGSVRGAPAHQLGQLLRADQGRVVAHPGRSGRSGADDRRRARGACFSSRSRRTVWRSSASAASSTASPRLRRPSGPSTGPAGRPGRSTGPRRDPPRPTSRPGGT